MQAVKETTGKRWNKVLAKPQGLELCAGSYHTLLRMDSAFLRERRSLTPREMFCSYPYCL